MLEKARRRFNELIFNHIIQHCANCEEPFRRHAQVRQPIIVHEDFLDDESGYSLWQIGPTLHDAQT